MSDDKPTFDLDAWRLKVTTAHLVSAGLEIVTSPPEPALTVCPWCQNGSTTVARRRLNTAYANDDSNYLTSCHECFEEVVEYYCELWQGYYLSR